MEEWSFSNVSVMKLLSISFYVIPYIMFYMAIGFRYGSNEEYSQKIARYDENPNIWSCNISCFLKRILLAFDLEIWYLKSLRFVIALKFLGPKLFMLQNMVSQNRYHE